MVTGFCVCLASGQTPIFCLAGGRGRTVGVIGLVSGGRDLGVTCSDREIQMYDNFFNIKMQFCKNVS